MFPRHNWATLRNGADMYAMAGTILAAMPGSGRYLVEVVLFLEHDYIKDFDVMYIGSDKKEKLNCQVG